VTIHIKVVDAKPERLLDTLHATNRDLYPAIYSIISIITDNTDVIGNKREIFQFDETLEILLKIDRYIITSRGFFLMSVFSDHSY
jgi:hypothetical protein